MTEHDTEILLTCLRDIARRARGYRSRLERIASSADPLPLGSPLGSTPMQHGRRKIAMKHLPEPGPDAPAWEWSCWFDEQLQIIAADLKAEGTGLREVETQMRRALRKRPRRKARWWASRRQRAYLAGGPERTARGFHTRLATASRTAYKRLVRRRWHWAGAHPRPRLLYPRHGG
jgi:hypothetical protein